VARTIGKHLERPVVVVNKSTVPVGTADKVRDAIAAELAARGCDLHFDVVSNPEFLKEGDAVKDCMRPDRIVVGTSSAQALEKIKRLYAPFNRNHDRIVAMDVRSAELTKYAANAMLATKISFMNEMANIAERVGADIEMVRHGIGSDPRIGYSFIYPGAATAVPASRRTCRRLSARRAVRLSCGDPEAVESVKRRRSTSCSKLIQRHFRRIARRRNDFAVWGLAFQAQHRRHARGVQPHLLPACGQPGRPCGLRSEAMDGGQRIYAIATTCAGGLRRRGAGRRRRADRGDRMEGVLEPGFQQDQGIAEGAGAFRRTQHLRAGRVEAAGWPTTASAVAARSDGD
jgi:UDPglucose 6-dehydrogenase